jgi:hypothetical protein
MAKYLPRWPNPATRHRDVIIDPLLHSFDATCWFDSFIARCVGRGGDAVGACRGYLVVVAVGPHAMAWVPDNVAISPSSASCS